MQSNEVKENLMLCRSYFKQRIATTRFIPYPVCCAAINAFALYQGHVEVVMEKTSYQVWDLPQAISTLGMGPTLCTLIWALCHLTGRKLTLREGRCTL
jgi:hypothetical protein